MGANHQTRRILLVDDDPTMLSFGRAALEALGHSVTCAASGADGIRLYTDAPFDMVLLDVIMPGVDGLEVLRTIREHDPGARVTLLTGSATKEVLLEALHLGADAFLEKPVSPEQLQSAVDRLQRPAAGRPVRGLLRSLSLPSLLQATCADRLKGRIRVRSDHDEVVLYVADGRVVHAESGSVRGEQAVYRALAFVDGEFEVFVGGDAPDLTVAADLQALLLEGMRRLDEGHERAAKPAPREPARERRDLAPLLAEELQRLSTEEEEIVAAAVLDPSGRGVATWGAVPGLDRPGFASAAVSLVAAARRPAGLADAGAVEECLVTTASMLMLVRPAGSYLLVLAGRVNRAGLGLMRLAARTLAARIVAAPETGEDG